MIALVTGPPGCGKTFYAVSEIAVAIMSGKYVATNVELVDGWADTLARQAITGKLSKRRRARLRERYERRYLPTPTVAELARLRMPGRGESRGVVVLDEAHLWLNSRAWRDEDRAETIKWFTQHRKLGWDVYLISQFGDSLDRQVRALAEYEITLRNLKRARAFGLAIIPINVFFARWYWAGHQKVLAKRQYRTLNRSVAGIYDTLAVHDSSGLDDSDATASLPLVYLDPLDEIGAAVPGRKAGPAGPFLGHRIALPDGSDAWRQPGHYPDELHLSQRVRRLSLSTDPDGSVTLDRVIPGTDAGGEGPR